LLAGDSAIGYTGTSLPLNYFFYFSFLSLFGLTNVPLGNYSHIGATGRPSARVGAVGWMDASANLWLFGGTNANGTSLSLSSLSPNPLPHFPFVGNLLNDLWKFSQGQWTWVGGAQENGGMTGGNIGANGYPGSLTDAGAWTDATQSSFFLYGGDGGM